MNLIGKICPPAVRIAIVLCLPINIAVAQTSTPSVTLSIAANSSVALPGQSVVFTVTEAFTGNGYDAAHTISATVPRYTSVQQADVSTAQFSASCSSGTWPCLAGEQVSWIIQTTAQQSQSMEFAATVSMSAPPPAGTLLTSVVTASLSGVASASTSVSAARTAGLQLAIDAQSSVAAASGALTYAISYANTSTAGAPASLTVKVPAQVSFASATRGGTYDAATRVVQWALGTVGAQASGQVILSVKVGKPVPGSPLITTTAALVNSTSMLVLAEASHTAQAIANPTQVSITARGPAQPGQKVLFTLSEVFTGAGYNSGHWISATVPTYTTVAQADVSTAQFSVRCSSGTWPCLAGQQIAWNIQTSTAESQSMQFAATVSSSAPPPVGSLLNSVVTADLSGAGTASTTVVAAKSLGPQLAIDARAGLIGPGSALPYVLTYANTSTSAVAAELQVSLPPEVTFVSASDAGTYDATTHLVQWSLGTLAAGASGQVTVSTTVSSPLVGSPLITTAAGLLKPTTSALLAQAGTTAAAISNPKQLTLTAASGPVLPGQALLYTVSEVFSDNGYNAGHAISATVPAFTSVAKAQVSTGQFSVNCSSGTWPCLPGEQVYWNLQSSAQQTQSMQFAATVSASNPPPTGALLTSVATADLSGVAAASTTVVAAKAAGLNLAIDAPTCVVAPGGALGYVLTYANTAATGIPATLLVTLPTQVSFVSATNGGSYDSATGEVRWQLGTLGAGASGHVSLATKVSTPLNGSPLIPIQAALTSPTTSALLAHASQTAEAASDLTQLGVSATLGPLGIQYAVTEYYSASGGYNVANNVYVTVPEVTTVSQSSGLTSCATGYCGQMTCSSGVWPCLATQQVYWNIQTDAGKTQSMKFSATFASGSKPPPELF